MTPTHRGYAERPRHAHRAQLVAFAVGVLALCLQLFLLLWSGAAAAEPNGAGNDSTGSPPIEVQTMTLHAQDRFRTQRTFSGRTVAARSSQLGFNRGGALIEVLVDTGDSVAQGSVLASLDTAALNAQERQAEADVALARASLAAAQAQARLAKNTETRIRRLHTQGHAPRQTLDEAVLNGQATDAAVRVAEAGVLRANAALQAVRVALQESRIHAPYDGTIQSREADEGTQVRAGQTVLHIVERGATEVHVGVPSRVAADLQIDAPYPILAGTTHLTARLRAILPQVASDTRSVTAVFNLAADADLPIGDVVELVFEESVETAGFWLPLSALTESDRGLWGVYVVNDDTRVQRRLVEVVHTEADRAFVRGTLADAERVVRTGVHRIVPGQRVAARPEAAASPTAGG